MVGFRLRIVIFGNYHKSPLLALPWPRWPLVKQPLVPYRDIILLQEEEPHFSISESFGNLSSTWPLTGSGQNAYQLVYRPPTLRMFVDVMFRFSPKQIKSSDQTPRTRLPGTIPYFSLGRQVVQYASRKHGINKQFKTQNCFLFSSWSRWH